MKQTQFNIDASIVVNNTISKNTGYFYIVSILILNAAIGSKFQFIQAE